MKTKNKRLNIEPLADYVFLRFKKETKTKSGVILSDVSKQKPSIAEVIAVGPGKVDRQGNFIKTQLKPGDMVIVDPFLPQAIKIDEEELWVVKEADIFAKKND